MGGDGGYKLKRSDLIKIKGWRLKKTGHCLASEPNTLVRSSKAHDVSLDAKLEKLNRIKLCHISKKPLQPPLLIDHSGNLVNSAELQNHNYDDIRKDVWDQKYVQIWPRVIKTTQDDDPSLHSNTDKKQTATSVPLNTPQFYETLYPSFNEEFKLLQCNLSSELLDSINKKFGVSLSCGCVWSFGSIDQDTLKRVNLQANKKTACPICEQHTSIVKLYT